MRSLSFVLWAALGSVFLVASGPFVQAAGPQTAFQVLVFSKTLGYRHASITNGIAAIRELGARNGFAADATEDSGAFTRVGLSRYAAVIFLSATGKVLDSDQEGALKDYVMGGGGFVAIHGAVFGPQACEDQWSWYGEMFCCAFTNHSQVVPAIVNLEDTTHASNEGLPAQWPRSDEWYNFTGTPRGCARVLATVDETTYTGGKMGQDHPIAWCRRVGQGRMWYTAMGHTESSFAEPLFQQHLLGGIRVATGRAPADFAPNARTAIRRAWKREAGSLALMQNESAVWQLNYGTNTTKPYFHPVAVPGGPVLTWDRPPDHPWHHALWFSWKFINGLNYWETEAQRWFIPVGGRTSSWARRQTASELTNLRLLSKPDELFNTRKTRMGKIKLGVNMEFVRHEDKSFEWGVARAAQLGYDCVEPMLHWGRELLSEAGYFHSVSMLDDPLRVKRACEKHQIALSGFSAHTPLCKPEISVEYLKQAIRFAAECGAPVVNTDEGPKPNWTTEEEDHTLMRYTLFEASKVADPRGILIGLEPHQQYSKYPEGLDRIYKLVKSPAIGINFDTGNSYLCGHDPYQWLQKVLGRLVHLHAKDISIQQSSSERGKVTGTPVGCACGEGVIDWARVIRICKKAKRDIVFSVECGTVAQAEASIKHLRSLL